MQIAESILKILASIFTYIAARGIDKIIGKWWARVSILWESTIMAGVMDGYREGMAEVQKNFPEKYSKWQEWRKSKAELKK